MSTSDRPPASGSVPRPSQGADDAAPAALSLPHEERLALARKLLAQGPPSENTPKPATTRASGAGSSRRGRNNTPDRDEPSGDGGVSAANRGKSSGGSGRRSPRDRSAYGAGVAAPIADEQRAAEDVSAGGDVSGDEGPSSERGRSRRSSRAGRGAAARGADPWGDLDDEFADDQPEAGRVRRRAGSIRRTAGTFDPWDEPEEATSTASPDGSSGPGSTGGRASTGSGSARTRTPAEESRADDAPGDAHAVRQPGEQSVRRGRSSRGSGGVQADPWGDLDDGTAQVHKRNATNRLAEARAFADDLPTPGSSSADHLPANQPPPSDRPATSQPSSARDGTNQPSSDHSATSQPSSDHSTTSRPLSDHSVAGELSADRSVTSTPLAGRAVASTTSSERPVAGRPSSDRLATSEPSSDRSGTRKQSSDRSGTRKQSSDRSGTRKQSSDRSGTSERSSDRSVAGERSSEESVVGKSSTEDSVAGRGLSEGSVWGEDERSSGVRSRRTASGRRAGAAEFPADDLLADSTSDANDPSSGAGSTLAAARSVGESGADARVWGGAGVDELLAGGDLELDDGQLGSGGSGVDAPVAGVGRGGRGRRAPGGSDEPARVGDGAEGGAGAGRGVRAGRGAGGGTGAGGAGGGVVGAGGGKRRGVGGRGFGGRRGKRRGVDGAEGVEEPGADGDSDPYAVARTVLLDKLTGQPRTRAELAGVLAEREIPDEVADQVLDRFTEVGLIDDAAFANAWVESRHRGRGLGKRALAQELRRRGVDDQLARDALEELDPEQEEDTARALVRRKLRSMRSLDRQVAMRRLLGMLARKGYPGGMAMSIIKEELDAGYEEFPLLGSSGLEPE
ncbi:RecX family transcriptional regulator [Kribbella hippodromi]|uniref:regulatory protein RecX n=1 Tax=Kribbella hippodromi TaxID=434347 RepID=UPI003CD0BEC4